MILGSMTVRGYSNHNLYVRQLLMNELLIMFRLTFLDDGTFAWIIIAAVSLWWKLDSNGLCIESMLSTLDIQIK